ncbi:hypothetical protein R3P38DRAFT_2788151 [Favolaschia claudopus]|uniref:Uncharacterized protein n=1 Tax=Favolaschia claudopus TaxID=2862362 RepID=A0AAW0ALV7_9AGAR
MVYFKIIRSGLLNVDWPKFAIGFASYTQVLPKILNYSKSPTKNARDWPIQLCLILEEVLPENLPHFSEDSAPNCDNGETKGNGVPPVSEKLVSFKGREFFKKEQLVEDVLDEELFEELMKAHIVEQDMEINSGDDDPPALTVVAKPTRTEALKAVVLLLKYLEETEGSFARHLEEELATFGRETQLECTKDMVSSSIANYFTRLYRRIYLRIIPMGMGYDSDDCIEGCKAVELCLDSVFASCIITSIFVTAVRPQFSVDK